jgi:hypothetical protein
MFRGLVSLTSLSINCFSGLRVESGAFKHLSNTLETLNLGENWIKIIELDAFKCLSKLKELCFEESNLAYDQLTDLKTNGELSPDAHIN